MSDLQFECVTKGGNKLQAPEHVIWFLVFGGISGWLAGMLTRAARPNASVAVL
jgi:hypothetical protein